MFDNDLNNFQNENNEPVNSSDFTSSENYSHEEIRHENPNSVFGYTTFTEEPTVNESVSDVNIKIKPKKKKTWLIGVVCGLAGILLGAAIFSVASPLIERLEDKFFDRNNAQFSLDNTNENVVTPANKPSTPEGELTAVEVGQKVGPAVVGISTEFQYQSFFGTTTSAGSGSGIIISEDGYIATNNHVINGASKVTVTTNSGKTYEAKLVGTDQRSDLAVIKIEAEDLYTADLGDSDNLQAGESVIAIGNPLGVEFAGSLTKGIVSALNRTVTVDNVSYTMIQTDAAINPGNSGGALVNMRGEVIGINSVKIANTDVEGLGFAIPINDAKPILEDIVNYGFVKGRPIIGVTVRYISEEEAKAYNLQSAGLFVFGIEKGSGADKAGIRRGDIIIKCEGEEVKSSDELNRIRDKHKAGDKLRLTINRDDDIIDVEVVLTEDTTESR